MDQYIIVKMAKLIGQFNSNKKLNTYNYRSMKFLTLLVILLISITFVSAFEDTLNTDALEDNYLLENESLENNEEASLENDEAQAVREQETSENAATLEGAQVLDAQTEAFTPPPVAAAAAIPVITAETVQTVPSVLKILLVIFGSIGGCFMFILPMGVIATALSTLILSVYKKRIAQHKTKQESLKATIENVTVDYSILDKKVVPGGSN
jgi:hypothetical protein